MPLNLPVTTHPPGRILVRGVNWLGDAVMTTPALLRLRERFPLAHIALLTPHKLADLWLHHPAINEVITFQSGESFWRVALNLRTWRFKKLSSEFHEGRRRRNLEEATGRALEFLALLNEVKTNPFDLALVLPNSPRSALEVWLARIPQRIGYARAWRTRLLTQPVPPRQTRVHTHKLSRREINKLVSESDEMSPGARRPTRKSYPATAHQVHEYLQLVSILGANPEPVPPLLEVTGSEIEAARQILDSELGSQGQGRAESLLFYGINAGAEFGPSKRWPPDRFAAAARELAVRAPNCVGVILGGPADQQLGRDISLAGGGNLVNLAGKTSLRQLMAVLKLCRVVLTNDTGPMHVAAALGTPVVVPFGSTAPELTGPGLPGETPHRLLLGDAPCAPCFRRECPIDFRCMHSISIPQVVDAVVSHLVA